MNLAKEHGAKRALPLPVSAPFHCSLMIPAGERLADVLADIKVGDMTVPVITNVEATPNQDASRVCQLLVDQVSAPVLWEDTIACMINLDVERYIEIGPGKVLAGLVKRMAKDSTIQNVQNVSDIRVLTE